MAEQKFMVPTEMIDLPSKGKLYPADSALAAGEIEMKYMTAQTEDILTNINLLKQGLAIDKMLKSLIKTEINYEDLTLGDRNALLVAARILGYGKDYKMKLTNPTTNEEEEVVVDLQTLKYKEVDLSLFDKDGEVTYELPYSKNVVTFKMLTVGDDKKIDEEIKAVKKTLGYEPGASFRLKFQLTSVNGDRTSKTIREFIDTGALLARDANPLRQYMTEVTPDIDMRTEIAFKDGTELKLDVPMQSTFFFPGLNL
jgi:hypothetical protein